MKYNPKIHHRRSIRLKGYDYSQPGCYFITICAQNRRCIFGEIIDGQMVLNEFGEIVNDEWLKIPDRFPGIELDVFQIMPDHFHGIINIVGATLAVVPSRAGASRAGASPAPTSTVPTVGSIIGAFKSNVSNEILKIFKSRNEHMGKLWQRNYYERIVRNEDNLNRIRQYIIDNPLKWNND